MLAKDIQHDTEQQRKLTKKIKGKLNRRGKKKTRNYIEKLIIIGTNANGLKSKKQSFMELLNVDKPQVFMVQETKLRKPNQCKIKGYESYERVRKEKGGGGIMIGVRNDIESTPVVVSTYDDTFCMYFRLAAY